TLNVGLRYDRFAAYVPAQSKEQGQFGGSGTFPRIDVGTWPVFGPRLGLAYDLTGDAKTVVKASWGWYNNALGDDFANFYAKNTGITTTYRWRDLNTNGDYDPGEVNLDLNGPDFISTAQIYYSSTVPGGVNNLRTPGLKDPHSTEAVVSVDRELMANFGVR